MQRLTSIRIQGETLGTAADAAGFLIALRDAYLNIHAFQFLGEHAVEGSTARRRPLVPLTNIDDLILPGEQLTIQSVRFASPGFWEFAGALNPLSVIREYLNDRHRRRQDREYRETFERERGKLELASLETTVLRERLDLLRTMGCTEEEVRRVFAIHVTRPLGRLGEYQDKGLAVYVDSSEAGPPPGFSFPIERPRSAAG